MCSVRFAADSAKSFRSVNLSMLDVIGAQLQILQSVVSGDSVFVVDDFGLG